MAANVIDLNAWRRRKKTEQAEAEPDFITMLDREFQRTLLRPPSLSRLKWERYLQVQPPRDAQE